MGAFLLIKKYTPNFSILESLKSFNKQGFHQYNYFKLKDWDLYLFQKQLTKHTQYIENEHFFICVVGTLVYKNKSIESTLPAVLSDLTNGINISENIIGGYFLIIYNKITGSIQFKTDLLGVQKTFVYGQNEVLSSSFISIVEGVTNSLTLNRDAIVENLCTGSIHSNETIVNEIVKFQASENEAERKKFFENHPTFQTKKESVEKQIEALDEYFIKIKPYFNNIKIDSGITGGFDSRLLFAMLKRHFSLSSIQLHSHRRKILNLEFLIGEKIAKNSLVSFVSEEVCAIEDIGDNVLENIIDEGLYFYDGQIITHAFWHEEFNTLAYRKKILGDHLLGLHGIGGEQYRNQERIIGKIAFDKWIEYGLIKKMAGEPFIHNSTKRKITEKLTITITEKLDIKNNHIGLLELKRFANEVYIPSNRGVRSNMENKISYFLCPYADPFVSRIAYGAVPFLGVSLNYQAEIINRVDPVLAKEISDYGFNFEKGEPFSKSLFFSLGENFIPWPIWITAIEKLKRETFNNHWKTIGYNRIFLKKLIELVKQYSLGINIDTILSRPDNGPLVYELGYFLKKYNHKIMR